MMRAKLKKIKKEKEKILNILSQAKPQSELELKYLCFLGELEREENALYKLLKVGEF